MDLVPVLATYCTTPTTVLASIQYGFSMDKGAFPDRQSNSKFEGTVVPTTSYSDLAMLVPY